MWPAVSRIATRNSVNFMQDGASCHTTPENISYLNDNFKGQVISNKTDVVWPPNSPAFFGLFNDSCLPDQAFKYRRAEVDC